MALYLGIVFGIGMLLEDVSKKFSSEHGGLLGRMFNFVMDTDKELRFRSLFHDIHQRGDGTFTAVPEPILLEILNLNPTNLDLAIKPGVETLREVAGRGATFAPATKGEADKIKNAINSVFYCAKNRAFREQTYFTEMKNIEERIGFASSF